MLQQSFLFAIKLSSVILQGSNIYKFKENKIKLDVSERHDSMSIKR
jgi:hypothetical protein